MCDCTPGGHPRNVVLINTIQPMHFNRRDFQSRGTCLLNAQSEFKPLSILAVESWTMHSKAPSLRILVVSNEHVVADSLASILRLQGHTAWTAYSAEEAACLAEGFVPHTVISDISMPTMNGIDLAMLLAEQQPDCKVLLITDDESASPGSEESVRRGNSHCILPVPIHRGKILELILDGIRLSDREM